MPEQTRGTWLRQAPLREAQARFVSWNPSHVRESDASYTRKAPRAVWHDLRDGELALHPQLCVGVHGAGVPELALFERHDELPALLRFDELALLAGDLEVVRNRAFVDQLEG